MVSAARARRQIVWTYRHSPVVRVTHWINVLCLAGLLMSGLQIFNATPALYWGAASDFAHPLLQMGAEPGANGGSAGVTRVFGHPFVTTGVFGLSEVDGQPTERGFPAWITLPGPQWLALGRRWHFFLAWLFLLNGIVYLVAGFASRHFRRDLLPTGEQLRHLPQTFADHLRLHFPKGEEAKHYNVLQKITYLVVIFVLLPLMLATGLSMSPGMDTAFPWLPMVFDGRQSARTIHFVTASLLVVFVLVHVAMVVLTGLWNNLRSMITGRYTVKDDSHALH